MSERDLPPLRVKIVGDDTSLQKSFADILKTANAIADAVKKISFAPLAAQTAQMRREIDRLRTQSLSKMTTDAAKLASLFSQIERSFKAVNRGSGKGGFGGMNMTAFGAAAANAVAGMTVAVRKVIQETSKILQLSVAKSAKLIEVAIRNGAKGFQTALIQSSKIVQSGLQAASKIFSSGVTSAAKVASAAINSAGKAVAAAIRAAGQTAAAAIRSAVSAYNTTVRTAGQVIRSAFTLGGTIFRATGGVVSTAIRTAGQVASAAIRGGSQMGATAIRQAGQAAAAQQRAAARRAMGGGSGMGAGLTQRADIYMHSNALQNISNAAMGLFDVKMQLDEMRVGFEAFTGGANKAADVMKEVQQIALDTPYDTITLATGARNMLAYGASVDVTMDSLKRLGDVAGGSKHRFDLLMYAMSQVNSVGILQGQELRQLTEQGFNPLVYWAEKTRKSYETQEQAFRRVKEAMSEGRITMDMVTEALKYETDAGGRFYKLAEKMNNTIRGLSNQIKELWQQIRVLVLDRIEHELMKFFRAARDGMLVIRDWVASGDNYQIVQQMAMMAIKAGVLLTALHALGLVVAATNWFFGSMRATFLSLSFILVPFQAAINGVTLAMSALRAVAAMGWAAFLGPIPLVIAGIGAIGLGIWTAINYIQGQGGLIGAFWSVVDTLQWVADGVFGFFDNFAENTAKIVEYFSANWYQMLVEAADIFFRVMGAIPNNIMVALSAGTRMIYAFGGWLWKYIPEMFENAFNKASTWLADFFMGLIPKLQKIWEYIMDPSQWLADAGQGINDYINTLRTDSKMAQEAGLGEAMKSILNEESQNFRTGLEGFESKLPDLELNLTRAKIDDGPMGPPKPDEAGRKPLPGGEDLPGVVAVAKNYEPAVALSATSGDFSRKMAEFSARASAEAAAKSPQVVEQKITNDLLRVMIGKLTGKNQFNLQTMNVGAIP